MEEIKLSRYQCRGCKHQFQDSPKHPPCPRCLCSQVRVKQYPNHDCLTIEEVAEAAGYSVDTIREREKNGDLKKAFPNARRGYHPRDVEAFLRGKMARV